MRSRFPVCAADRLGHRAAAQVDTGQAAAGHDADQYPAALRRAIWYLHYQPSPEYVNLLKYLSLIVDVLSFVAAALVYAVTHGEMGMRVARQNEQLLKAEQARVSVMLSQIQPHFNVLNTIYHLCKMDAGRAQQAVGNSSEYLRGNINVLRCSESFPFKVELNNVRNCLDLEKLLFEEELNIVYTIRTTAIMLPTLTLQPIVENAVRHGICKKPDNWCSGDGRGV